MFYLAAEVFFSPVSVSLMIHLASLAERPIQQKRHWGDNRAAESRTQSAGPRLPNRPPHFFTRR
jgi:hypothetical protein